MPEYTTPDHDIDAVERLIVRFNEAAAEDDTKRRRYIAELIVEDIQMNALLNELRCLRERVLSPCADPLGHTHAREA
ncbi:hypothetical protein [Actinoplanes regularis]|uniref:Uncharacterized protein n=1 Tax=Actinoplanes regularis TaxID=52697 RepID=A0A239GTZ6_9ACTN|nr:hypothetical protein [Actinoplanes regularis]GIE90890.1 hypothetical protein Are01nite_73700 [Actinoplanes regularis]SNS72696.1 hypothetical protein SAMN06264365_12271 [Actinoplanes regularis]